MRLAIIGTAGRGPDGTRLAANSKVYVDTMRRAALKVAELTGADTLISGGAAWADHMAVVLFLTDQRFSLDLELPAPMGLGGHDYVYEDTGQRDARANPGGTANHYHRLFRAALQTFDPDACPFMDLIQVRPTEHLQGLFRCAKVTVTPGFLARNLVVAAKTDHVLAMTFGSGRTLKDGGTAHTMRAFLARPDHGRAFHLDLNTLKLYEGATV